VSDWIRRYGCEVQQWDRRWTLALTGEIDLAAVARFEAVLRLVEPLSDALALDLNAVTFMDSAGAGFLVRAVDRAREARRAIALVRPSGVARRMLEDHGLYVGDAMANGDGPRPHALVATDLQGRVTDWNGAAQALFGWQSWEAVGRPIATVAVCPQDEAVAREITNTVNRNEIWDGQFDVVHRDGRALAMRVRETLIRDQAGRSIGLLRLAAAG
jgi:anti-anti-sigma factor